VGWPWGGNNGVGVVVFRTLGWGKRETYSVVEVTFSISRFSLCKIFMWLFKEIGDE
jgi:hypothetical protein